MAYLQVGRVVEDYAGCGVYGDGDEGCEGCASAGGVRHGEAGGSWGRGCAGGCCCGIDAGACVGVGAGYRCEEIAVDIGSIAVYAVGGIVRSVKSGVYFYGGAGLDCYICRSVEDDSRGLCDGYGYLEAALRPDAAAAVSGSEGNSEAGWAWFGAGCYLIDAALPGNTGDSAMDASRLSAGDRVGSISGVRGCGCVYGQSSACGDRGGRSCGGCPSNAGSVLHGH